MAIDYVVAEQTAIAGTDVVVYTTPASKIAVISAAVIGNTFGSAQDLDNIKLGGNVYIAGKSIPSEGQILTELEGQILTAGQTITVTDFPGVFNLRISLKVRDA